MRVIYGPKYQISTIHKLAALLKDQCGFWKVKMCSWKMWLPSPDAAWATPAWTKASQKWDNLVCSLKLKLVQAPLAFGHRRYGFPITCSKNYFTERKKFAMEKVLQFTVYNLQVEKWKKNKIKNASERGLEEGQFKSSNWFAKHSKVLSLNCTTFV